MAGKIKIVKKDIGYEIREGDFLDGRTIAASELYVIHLGNHYLLCFEKLDECYIRMGARKKDIEELVFFVTDNREEAFNILKQRMEKEAELLAKIRGYDLDLSDKYCLS